MDDAQFDQFLKSRKVAHPVPASFRREVWKRIEVNPAQRGSWLGATAAFLKHSLAGAACAGVALGIWLGSSRPEATKVAYLESINPVSHLHRR